MLGGTSGSTLTSSRADPVWWPQGAPGWEPRSCRSPAPRQLREVSLMPRGKGKSLPTGDARAAAAKRRCARRS